MAYLGNKPVNNFVSFAKQDITGNGGTSYSLDYPVTGANDIELYINNVRQEPTEAYSCSGSTLTLTEAVSSSDDVYAIFRGRALQTVVHPSDSALEASQATISGDATITGNAFIGANGTAVPNANLASNLDFLQVGTGAIIQAGADSQSFIKSNHYWNGSSTSFQDTTRGSTTIRLNENNAGILQFETATSGGVGTASRLTIDASGRVTTPYQPVFRARLGSTIANPNGQVITFTVSELDTGNNYNTSNSRYTAPVAGKYFFGVRFYAAIRSGGLRVLHNNWRVNGSNILDATMGGGTGGDGGYSSHPTLNDTCILSLNANDCVDFYLSSRSSTGNFDLENGYFYGYLIG